MSDILFRFLLMARRRESSSFRRLFLRDEQLLEAGVEQLVETAAARISVTSQHERIRHKSVTVPASQHRQVRFYKQAQPHRPVAGNFERRSESFPLSETLRIDPCTACSGHGTVKCRTCYGSGRRRCSSCGGSGTIRSQSGKVHCGTCGASGTSTCRTCGGSGRERCSTCAGEGQMASWQIEVYEWRIEHRRAEQLPLGDRSPSRLRGAFHRWLKIDKEVVAELRPAEAVRHLGFESPEALEVVARAEEDRRRLESEARHSTDTYLFHRTVRSLAPVGYSVVRLGGRASWYWLVGRGEKAREVTPWGRPDPRKGLGWLGLGSGSFFALAAVAWTDFFTHLPAFGDPSILGLAGGLLVSSAMTLAGALRIRSQAEPVQAIGFFHDTGEPTSWLACLAYLGSYTGKLSVVDRAYTTQTERLLGKKRATGQSESLAVRLADGRKVFLIEVARPDRLTDKQLALALAALDGMVILEDQEPRARQSSRTFETRARSLAKRRLRISKAKISKAPSEGSPEPEGMPLESIRAAFVGELDAPTDWLALFERIWQPIERLLVDPAAKASGEENAAEGESAPHPRVLSEARQSVSHELVGQDPELSIPHPDGVDEGAHPRSRGLRQELPHRDPGAVHLPS